MPGVPVWWEGVLKRIQWDEQFPDRLGMDPELVDQADDCRVSTMTG